MSRPGPMTTELVLGLLDALERAGVTVWVGGGWGVDALVGRRTRDHRDLDLMYRLDDDPALRAVLDRAGYVVETDWWPVRVELAGASYVDVHPLRFAADGSAVQAGMDGARFDYPAAAFTQGLIGGRRVGCLSVAQQRLFHSGYPLREVDHHDLALLDEVSPPRR